VSASGRTGHAEKITVYLTPDELARLDKLVCHIRHDLGIKTDRGRVVREALGLIREDVHRGGGKSAVVKRLGIA
jgi:hypothetical protein